MNIELLECALALYLGVPYVEYLYHNNICDCFCFADLNGTIYEYSWDKLREIYVAYADAGTAFLYGWDY